jgi:hypothetical protein
MFVESSMASTLNVSSGPPTWMGCWNKVHGLAPHLEGLDDELAHRAPVFQDRQLQRGLGLGRRSGGPGPATCGMPDTWSCPLFSGCFQTFKLVQTRNMHRQRTVLAEMQCHPLTGHKRTSEANFMFSYSAHKPTESVRSIVRHYSVTVHPPQLFVEYGYMHPLLLQCGFCS